MPSSTQTYNVMLDFTNDTHDSATLQLLRDYGQRTDAIILLRPGESVSLILDAGSAYQYALKKQSKVVNVTARAWRDVQCALSQLFPSPLHPSYLGNSEHRSPVNGITVDRLFREVRFCIFNDRGDS